jgi:hypothetical protein
MLGLRRHGAQRGVEPGGLRRVDDGGIGQLQRHGHEQRAKAKGADHQPAAALL